MKKIINLDKEFQVSTIEGKKLIIETENHIITMKDKNLFDIILKWKDNEI